MLLLLCTTAASALNSTELKLQRVVRVWFWFYLLSSLSSRKLASSYLGVLSVCSSALLLLCHYYWPLIAASASCLECSVWWLSTQWNWNQREFRMNLDGFWPIVEAEIAAVWGVTGMSLRKVANFYPKRPQIGTLELKSKMICGFCLIWPIAEAEIAAVWGVTGMRLRKVANFCPKMPQI